MNAEMIPTPAHGFAMPPPGCMVKADVEPGKTLLLITCGAGFVHVSQNEDGVLFVEKIVPLPMQHAISRAISNDAFIPENVALQWTKLPFSSC